MSTSKSFDRIAAVIAVLGLLFTLLFMNGEALGIEKVIDEDAEQYETTSDFTWNDLDGDWDASDPTAAVTLNGDSATIKGNGAYFNDGSVVITGAGKYVFSGTLTDGSIVVDAYDSSKVFILLSGVELYCSDDACLRVDQADKVFLTLAADTENRMESGETYSQTALDDNTGGTIFAHDDLTINGGGSLVIAANYKHGIDANDDLVIAGGTITVTAPSDGLHVSDSFRMCKASLRIAAGDDAIHSDTDIYIESGTLLITECYEGLEALRIEVAGGDLTIYPTDDAFNANGGSGGFGGGFGGGPGGGPGNMGGPTHSSDDSERPERPEGSEEGERPEPPDGFDGERPDFSGGEATSTPDMSEMPAPPDMGGMPDGAPAASGDDSSEDEDAYVIISGGNILIVNENARDADGIDSNGSVYITGGSILVSLNGNGSNNAIDYGSENGGVAEISGGSVIACGGSAMAESFDESSTQPSIAYTGSVAAGSTVALRDAKGSVLLEWEVPCGFTYLLISCPEMTVGETYTLQMGDTAEEVTLESVVTTLGSSSGGMGGGPGGMGGGNHGAPPGGSGSGNG